MENQLKAERKRQGLTQLELAKQTDIHPIEISKIERGAVRAYPGWRKRISAALGVSEEILFPGVD